MRGEASGNNFEVFKGKGCRPQTCPLGPWLRSPVPRPFAVLNSREMHPQSMAVHCQQRLRKGGKCSQRSGGKSGLLSDTGGSNQLKKS